MGENVCAAFARSAPAAVCRHISELLRCHVCYMHADHTVQCMYVCGRPASNPNAGELFSALFGARPAGGQSADGQSAGSLPEIRQARPGEAYLSVCLFTAGIFTGRLAAGPVSIDAGAGQNMKAAGGDGVDYIVSAAALLYYTVYERWADDGELRRAAMSARPSIQNREPESLPRPSGADNPGVHAAHHTVAYENRIYSLITQGNVEGLTDAIGLPPDGIYGLLDKRHPLRSLKNDCICTLTLATRAAIAGGLDSETAFSLSDDTIQKIELYDDVSGLYRVVEQTLFHLTGLVESIRSLNHSWRVNYCRNYVMQHVFEKLTVAAIAAHAGVSPEYLTERFKKETGVSLKTFIGQTRVEEAKRLLLSTRKSILEITLTLNYHDQSHFIRSFKKATGLTPAAFRKSNPCHAFAL